MFQYFFTENSDLPAGLGFNLFDSTHLLWLLFIALACFFICIGFCRNPRNSQNVFARQIAVLLLVLEIAKDILLFVLGEFALSYLPFHLCGLAIFMCVWHAFSGSALAGELCYSLAMPGAVAALIFPDWTMYPNLNFFLIQSFVMHGLLIAYTFMHVFAKTIKPRVYRLWVPVLFLAVSAPLLFLFNKRFGTNFMFLNYPSPGSILELFEQYLGNPGYLLGVAVFLLIIWAVIYAPFYYVKVHSKS